MFLKLTQFQTKAVDAIFQIYLNSFHNQAKNKVEFQAPTGSGKTFMIANLIDKIINYHHHRNTKIIFIMATISVSDLPQQLEIKFKEYTRYLEHLQIEQIKNIKSPSENQNATTKIVKDKDYEINYNNNDILIFGKSSFGKERILSERGIIKDTIHSLKNEGYQIIYIRDEAHIGTLKTNTEKNLSEEFEVLLHNQANFTILTTATLKKNGYEHVLLTEKDLEHDDVQLIKTKYDLSFIDSKKNDVSFDEFIKMAITKIQKIQKIYANNSELKEINPAFLIQISNESQKPALKSEFNEKLSKLKELLEKKNLKWAQYFDSSQNGKASNYFRENFTLKDLSKNNSPIDVIIFKIGPATGWDIPRACALLQLRNVTSKNLSIQTIGRIKRNPVPQYSQIIKRDINHPANVYYVFSEYTQKEQRDLAEYKLKENYLDLTFPKGIVQFNQIIIKKSEQEYLDKVKNLLIKNKKLIFEKIIQLKKQDKISWNFFWTDNSTIKVIDYLENIIELKIKIKNAISDNPYLIMLQKMLKKFWIKEFKNAFSIEFLWYLIWDENWQLNFQIQELYKALKNKKAENIQFKIQQDATKLTIKYTNWISNNKEGLIKIANDHLFVKKAVYERIFSITKNKADEYPFEFQSIPENHFFTMFYKWYIATIKKPLIWEKDFFWTKNPSPNGIELQYYDEIEAKIKKSYPDFISQINKNIFYIEVKSSLHDYNPQKTAILAKAYQQYQKINDQEKGKIFFIIAKYVEQGKFDFHVVGQLKKNIDSFNEIIKIIENFKKKNHLS